MNITNALTINLFLSLMISIPSKAQYREFLSSLPLGQLH